MTITFKEFLAEGVKREGAVKYKGGTYWEAPRGWAGTNKAGKTRYSFWTEKEVKHWLENSVKEKIPAAQMSDYDRVARQIKNLEGKSLTAYGKEQLKKLRVKLKTASKKK